jgi:hypothetical protein
MNTKSQVDFDRLLQLNMLDKTEEDKDMSWECHNWKYPLRSSQVMIRIFVRDTQDLSEI